MANTHFDEEQREQWMAFMQSIFAASDPRAMRLMDEFRMVAHQLYQLNESSLAATGLSYAQFRLLMSLYYCEWRGNCEGLNPSEISARQGTSRNTISGLIKSLEDGGLVMRHLDKVDRRRFNIQLTDAGRQIIHDHSSNHIRMLEMLFQELRPEELETLSALLQKLNRRATALKEAGASAPTRGSYASN